MRLVNAQPYARACEELGGVMLVLIVSLDSCRVSRLEWWWWWWWEDAVGGVLHMCLLVVGGADRYQRSENER